MKGITHGVPYAERVMAFLWEMVSDCGMSDRVLVWFVLEHMLKDWPLKHRWGGGGG